MKVLRWVGAAVVVGAAIGAANDTPVEACSDSSALVMDTSLHPDLPLDGFAAGHIGLLKSTFARSYLVVAFRWLDGVGLDAKEQAGALSLWNARLSTGWEAPVVATANPIPSPIPIPIPIANTAASGSGGAGPSVSSSWVVARAAVAGGAAAPIVTSFTKSFAAIENCLADAFDTAAATLADRERRFGTKSREVLDWIAAQDAVFANCGGATPTVPGPTPSGDPLVRADRDYQIASAHFYAANFPEAERRFRMIAVDSTSPWRPFGRYLAARAETRQAMLAGPKPDPIILAKAEQDIRSVLADPQASRVHGPARRYLSLVRFRTDPAGLTHDLGIRLAHDRLDDDCRSALGDYTALLDENAAPLALTAPDSDRLAAWIGVVQADHGAGFTRAVALFERTRATPWLVATLMTALNPRDPRLDDALQAAEALAPDSPAFATARYHRARIMLGRNAPRAFRDVVRDRALLKREDGPSTKNDFTQLALRAAPDLDAMLANSFVTPVGWEHGEPPVVPIDAKHAAATAFFPEAVDAIARLPLERLTRAARATALPVKLRGVLAADVFVRAMLLGDHRAAAVVADVARSESSKLAPFLDRIRHARGDDDRRLSLITMLLKFPALSLSPRAWESGAVAEEPMDTSYGTYGWCAASPSTTAPAPILFLTATERREAEAEARRLAALGSSPTFLAEEAARLAGRLPADPRVPEALHLAVRATRFGCKDARNSQASRAAFRALHSRFPGSVWAKRTPYYY